MKGKRGKKVLRLIFASSEGCDYESCFTPSESQKTCDGDTVLLEDGVRLETDKDETMTSEL
jgi:hypothetical protein